MVGVAEAHRSLVAKGDQLEHEVGRGRAHGLRGLPGLATQPDVIGPQQDLRDLVVVHPLAVDRAPVGVEHALDACLELHEAATESIVQLIGQQLRPQPLQLSALDGVEATAGQRFVDRREARRIPQCLPQAQLGLLAAGLGLVRAVDVGVPPGARDGELEGPKRGLELGEQPTGVVGHERRS